MPREEDDNAAVEFEADEASSTASDTPVNLAGPVPLPEGKVGADADYFKRAGVIGGAADGGDRAQRAAEDRAKTARNDFVHLIQMQISQIRTRIDQLDAEIAGYDAEMMEMAERIFTEDEMNDFRGLPEDQMWEAMDKAMREKFERGEITQEDYDRWRKTYDDKVAAKSKRDDYVRRRQEILDDPTLAEPERAERLEKLRNDIAYKDSAIATRQLDEPSRRGEETQVEGVVDTGRGNEEHTDSDFDNFMADPAPEASRTASAAAEIDPAGPQTTPPTTEHFQTAATATTTQPGTVPDNTMQPTRTFS